MTNNTSPKLTLKMRVWATIRNNPGMNSKEIWAKFPDDGQSSISSILSTLDFSDVIFSTKAPGETTKRYYTSHEAYPAKKAATRKPAVKAYLELQQIKLVDTPTIPQEITTTDHRIEELFNTLSLNESRQLYKRLQSIFGLEAVC